VAEGQVVTPATKAGLILTAVILLLAIVEYLRARSRRRASSTATKLAPPTELAPPKLIATDGSRYKPGQVWSLRMPNAPQARLLILRVELLPLAGTFVHVAVSGVPVPVGHMPFTEAAIDRSVADLVGTEAVRPELLEGYDEWRKAFDNQGAGVFSVTVPEALKVVQ
jgi:hypothetical protein